MGLYPMAHPRPVEEHRRLVVVVGGERPVEESSDLAGSIGTVFLKYGWLRV